MNIVSLILIIHLISITSFVVGAFLFFKNNNTINHRKLIKIQFVSLVLWILGPYLLIKHLDSPLSFSTVSSLLLQIITLSLFTYLILKIGRGKLLVAGSDQEPLNFFSDGPYKYVRHPFYFAYIFNYIGIFILTLNIIYLILVLIIFYLYYLMATEEESLFLKSIHKNQYVIYQSQTDKLVPFVKIFKQLF